MKKTEKVYVGDGVYVRWDGFALELTTERAEGTHWIVLEPQVWANLTAFVERLERERRTPPTEGR